MSETSSQSVSPTTQAKKPVFDARHVAWSLTAATCFCLAAGIAAVEYIGRDTGAVRPETNPEKIDPLPVTAQGERPTVLLNSSNEPNRENADGKVEFFAPPQDAQHGIRSANQPSGPTSTHNQQRFQ